MCGRDLGLGEYNSGLMEGGQTLTITGERMVTRADPMPPMFCAFLGDKEHTWTTIIIEAHVNVEAEEVEPRSKPKRQRMSLLRFVRLLYSLHVVVHTTTPSPPFTHAHAHTHTHTHTYTRTRTHTHTCTRKHTHTHAHKFTSPSRAHLLGKRGGVSRGWCN